MKRNHFQFQNKELNELIKNPNSLVIQTPCVKHIALAPINLKNFQESIREHLDKELGKFDTSYNGILLGYNNIKLLEDIGSISFDEYYIHIDFQCTSYVFQPKLGSVLTGTVCKIGCDYLALLLYNCFNVTVPVKKDNVKLGDELEFKIKYLSFSEKRIPFIQGELMNILSNNDTSSSTIEFDKEVNNELTLENINENIPKESSSEDTRDSLDSTIKSKPSKIIKSILKTPKIGLIEETPKFKTPKIRFSEGSTNTNEKSNHSKESKKSKKKLFEKFNDTFDCNETFKEEVNNEIVLQAFCTNLNDIHENKKKKENLKERKSFSKSSKKTKTSENLKIESNNNKIDSPTFEDTLNKSTSRKQSPEKNDKKIDEFCTNFNEKLNESNDIVSDNIKEENGSSKKHKKSKKLIVDNSSHLLNNDKEKDNQIEGLNNSYVKLMNASPLSIRTKKNKEAKSKKKVDSKSSPSKNNKPEINENDILINNFLKSITNQFKQESIDNVDDNETKEHNLTKEKKKRKRVQKDQNDSSPSPKKNKFEPNFSQDSLPELSFDLKNTIFSPTSNSVNQKNKKGEMSILTELKKPSRKSSPINRSASKTGLIMLSSSNEMKNQKDEDVEKFINTAISNSKSPENKKSKSKTPKSSAKSEDESTSHTKSVEKKHKSKKSNKNVDDISKIKDNLLNSYLKNIQK